jgi:hypothetical protein
VCDKKVPMVVVLTKYDEFIVHVERMLDGSLEGLGDDAVNKLVKQKADAKLRDICTLPLERFAGSDIPYATVSSVFLSTPTVLMHVLMDL